MKLTARTKKCKKLGILFHFISWFLCFGTALTFVIVGISRGWGSGNTDIKDTVGSVVYGIGVSLIPMAILAIVVKDRIRPTVWMIDIILANYLFDSWLMYIVFAAWLIDQYIIAPLAKSYTNKYTINKEIDRRGQ